MIPPEKKKDFLSLLNFEMEEANYQLSQTMGRTFSTLAAKGLGNSGALMRKLNQDAVASLKDRANCIFNELLKFLKKQKIFLDAETRLEAEKLLKDKISSQKKSVNSQLISNHIFRDESLKRAAKEIQKDFDQKADQLITNFSAKFRLAAVNINQANEKTSSPFNPKVENEIWGDSGFRLFISHKAEIKDKAMELKTMLQFFGISAFVAHKDIVPTEEWREIIEVALSTMDGLVALLTEDFHESDWTDQEIGYALARKVPIVSVPMGRGPYGFFGKYQALSASWEKTPEEIAKTLIKKSDRMFVAYVERLRNCEGFSAGNDLAKILWAIRKPTSNQMRDLIEVYNSNGQLQGSYGFNGRKPSEHGSGLLAFLNKWGEQKFEMKNYHIEPAK